MCPHDGETLIKKQVAAVDPLLGEIFDGRYRIDELIGEGGMGRVYRATQLNIGRDVAIKVLNATASQDSEVVARFEAEARIISLLRCICDLKHCRLDMGNSHIITDT